MSKKRKRKLNNLQAEKIDKGSAAKNQKKSDDYDFENAVYPDNSDLKVPPEDNEPTLSEGDVVMQKIGKEAVVGEYNFINVAVVFILIMIMGISFALLRNTDEYVENNNKISAETVLNGKFTKKLSNNYMKRLPGKQLLLDTNKCFSYVYGLGSFNDEKSFVSADTGQIIGIKTYDEPVFVTLTTAPTTTTQYTGKTTNTTKKLNKTLFVGPGQLTTTKKTKKTTTKKTTEKTTTVSTTKFTGTTWSFKGTTTWNNTTTSVENTTVATTASTTLSTTTEEATRDNIDNEEQ